MEQPFKASATRVLVIDDDVRLQVGIRDFLESYGYEIHSLYTGRDVQQTLSELMPDIVLLDVMLPEYDGFTILQQLRRTWNLPVIMLTALGDDTDRIVGLEMGADDYLPKPFNPRELLARIKAVLRRMPPLQEEPLLFVESSTVEFIELGPLSLDIKRQRLSRAGQELLLPTTAFRIIYTFMRHAGEVLSRNQLLSLAFGEDYFVNDRNIDVHISRIRTMLRSIGDSPSRIQTVWGTGYCWIKDN